MKVDPGFFGRLKGEVARVRNAGKDELRRFFIPKMAFPVSEGMSDAPVSSDLVPPGKLDAAKKKERGNGFLKFPHLLFSLDPVMLAKAKPARVTERPTTESVKRHERLPDATIPLDEKSVGTITFDTSKGSTMVS